MPRCAVPACGANGRHLFPKDPKFRKLWEQAIKRKNFKAGANSRLCHRHFKDSDYPDLSSSTGKPQLHKYLKKDVVPSIFPWMKTPAASAIAKEENKDGDGTGSSSQPQHVDQKHVCSQIKHSLQQLRRKSNPEPEKPTLELEVYSEPNKIDIEEKDTPDIDIDETSLYVDESQPLEEDETEDDKIQETKKKTTKPPQISKLQTKKLKRNPRRKVVLKRLQKEAIEAARGAPGIERVYLDKSDELPTDDLPLTLQQKEELYEFGKFVAEQLMTFNQKDVKEAHNEIMEVIKKYRLKYKILNCVTKTSATKPTTTKTNLSNGRPMSKTESQQPSTSAKIKSLLHSASLQQHKTVSKPPSLVKPHTAPADIIQPIQQAENPMSNTQSLNPFTADKLKSLLLAAPLKKLESVSKPRTLVKPPAAPANTIQPIRQAEKIPGKTLKTYKRQVKSGQKEAGDSTPRLAVNTTLSTLTLGSGGADEIPLSLVLVPSKDGSLQLTTARVDAAGTIMTFPNAPRVNIEPIPANMSHPGVSGAQPNLKLLQLAQDVGSTVVQMPQTSATVQQPIKQVPTNTGAASQQDSQSNDVTKANPERFIDAPNISHDIALDPLKVEPMETMDDESESEEPVSVSQTDTEKVVFKCEVASDEDSDSD